MNLIFNYSEIVRLKKDFKNTNLKIGDYGVIWAVYSAYIDESKTSVEFDYEGTFENRECGIYDLMFCREDAEKVLIMKEISFSEDTQKLWLFLTQNKDYSN